MQKGLAVNVPALRARIKQDGRAITSIADAAGISHRTIYNILASGVADSSTIEKLRLALNPRMYRKTILAPVENDISIQKPSNAPNDQIVEAIAKAHSNDIIRQIELSNKIDALCKEYSPKEVFDTVNEMQSDLIDYVEESGFDLLDLLDESIADKARFVLDENNQLIYRKPKGGV